MLFFLCVYSLMNATVTVVLGSDNERVYSVYKAGQESIPKEFITEAMNSVQLLSTTALKELTQLR